VAKWKKVWSISTAVRNPERLPSFLRAIEPLIGREWDEESQKDLYIYEIALRIRNQIRRSRLSPKSIDLLEGEDELSYEQAKLIFEENGYVDSAMRGRQDRVPLIRCGLLHNSDVVKLTPLGESMLSGEIDFSTVMKNFAFKWQLPELNLGSHSEVNGFSIKPFIGTLALIDKVNEFSKQKDRTAAGLDWDEFCYFVPTLIKHDDISRWAEVILKHREEATNLPGGQRREFKAQLAKQFLIGNGSVPTSPNWDSLFDYGDNTFRYFKTTGMLSLRGGGNYVDISPTHLLEAKMLIEHELFKPLAFNSGAEYTEYLIDLNSFTPPWATPEKVAEIENELRRMIVEQSSTQQNDVEVKTETLSTPLMSENTEIAKLKAILTGFQLSEITSKSTTSEFLEACADDFRKLKFPRGKTDEMDVLRIDRVTYSEYLSYKSLLSINDLEKIKPNYPTNEEGFPTFHAGGGVADLEIFYKDFNAICEITLLTGSQQMYKEGQPVQRHLADFMKSYSDKDAFGIFIAPSIHVDTANTFRQAYFSGHSHAASLKILPFSFDNWVSLLLNLSAMRRDGKRITQSNLYGYFSSLLPKLSNETCDDWVARLNTADKILEFIK